jgi:phage gpG-like protein
VPTTVRFEFFGEEQIARTLEGIEDRAEDASEAWEAIADRFVVAQRRQFASEGGYGSGGWSPLSPRYAAWKARHYPGKGILERTDELRRSLTEGPEVRIIQPHDAWIGSTVGYGRYHQGGDGVPRRRPVEFPESERREWAKIVQRFLRTGGTS